MRYWSIHQHLNLNKQPHNIWDLVTSTLVPNFIVVEFFLNNIIIVIVKIIIITHYGVGELLPTHGFHNIMNHKMIFITSGSMTSTTVTIHYINLSTIIQLAISSANTIKVHYIIEPQQNNSCTPSWVIIIILAITIIILLRITFHNNKIMFLAKSFSYKPDEAHVDDLVKACA